MMEQNSNNTMYSFNRVRSRHPGDEDNLDQMKVRKCEQK